MNYLPDWLNTIIKYLPGGSGHYVALALIGWGGYQIFGQRDIHGVDTVLAGVGILVASAKAHLASK
jgi:hypothetical protein